ncbi:MFS transporter [Burkholderia ubonensis]|uniref:MFS transporter n=1 Tax=Burkholderia ubonensis TaxID=101571 RepID=UPI0011AF0B55|nr:MFS transporter [Burkholderia ubonensis]
MTDNRGNERGGSEPQMVNVSSTENSGEAKSPPDGQTTPNDHADAMAEFESWRKLAEAEDKAALERRRRLTQRIIISSAIMTTGAIVSLGSFYGLKRFFEDHGLLIIGTVLLLSGLLYAMLPSLVSPTRLSDVDTRRNLRPASLTRVNPAAAWPFPTGDLGDLEDLSEVAQEGARSRLLTSRRDPFASYFHELKDTLQEKANDADEKASILLDRGASYTKWGIYFFIFSIVAWQAISWIHGFQTIYIYGIASCSALFIFIEFLSAWFLRQYRHYVDTSTYLLKVKAIFDRFMLIYLANDTLSPELNKDQQKRAEMFVELLGKEIKWPETYLLKQQDVSFAKEAMEAVTSLTKELRQRDANKETLGKKTDEHPNSVR